MKSVVGLKWNFTTEETDKYSFSRMIPDQNRRLKFWFVLCGCMKSCVRLLSYCHTVAAVETTIHQHVDQIHGWESAVMKDVCSLLVDVESSLIFISTQTHCSSATNVATHRRNQKVNVAIRMPSYCSSTWRRTNNCPFMQKTLFGSLDCDYKTSNRRAQVCSNLMTAALTTSKAARSSFCMRTKCACPLQPKRTLFL